MHTSLSDLTRRIDRVLHERLIPAVHGDRVPLDVTGAHLPGEPVPFAEAARLPFRPVAVGSPRDEECAALAPLELADGIRLTMRPFQVVTLRLRPRR